jgi:hypothetical protein
MMGLGKKAVKENENDDGWRFSQKTTLDDFDK